MWWKQMVWRNKTIPNKRVEWEGIPEVKITGWYAWNSPVFSAEIRKRTVWGFKQRVRFPRK